MNDLLNKIRNAQIRAGEEVVIASLKEKGLVEGVELLAPSKFNDLQSIKEPQLHLGANDGETAKEATQMVFHKMNDGTLFCEVYAHESKKDVYTYDAFTFDESAKNILKAFLNDDTKY
jgi:hypothetical protein